MGRGGWRRDLPIDIVETAGLTRRFGEAGGGARGHPRGAAGECLGAARAQWRGQIDGDQNAHKRVRADEWGGARAARRFAQTWREGEGADRLRVVEPAAAMLDDGAAMLGRGPAVRSDAGSDSGETAARVARAAGGWGAGFTHELSLGAVVVRSILMNNDTRRVGSAGSWRGHSR